MRAPGGCVGDEELAGYLEGWLEPTRSRAVAEHIDACASCRQVLAASVRDAEPPPERPRVPGRRELQPGDRLDRFELRRALPDDGRGFVAFDPQHGSEVALEAFITDPARAERVVAVARALAGVRHPGLIVVHEAGVFERGAFVVTELLGGGTLRRWLHTGSRPWRAVVERFARAGEGVHAAHEAGLWHGELHAGQILLDDDGRLRVGRFGIARALASDAPTGPHTTLRDAARISGSLTLTPAYSAPEQLRGGPADARADQFGFCVALYWALYGELPFAGDDAPSLLRRIEAGELRAAPRSTRVPGRVREVLVRGLAANPEARFASMRALVDALRAAARRRFF
jgi:serine/threonine protein kinase